MPEKETIERARKDKREGKAPTTQAGEFIREEMHHIREGKHGATSAKQAIAIGLSKARRAGVDLPPPKTGSAKTKRSAELAYERGHGRPAQRRPSARRSQAIEEVLKREPRSAATHRALARQAHAAAAGRSSASRSASARKAAKTKGAAGRSAAARKAARTRAAA
jgi:hypothetical protein